MALLGLLYNEPGHGYDLHRKVIADLDHVWHLSQKPGIFDLEARGDISFQEVPREKLPPRLLLNSTEQGRKSFMEWLQAVFLSFITNMNVLKKIWD